MAKQQSFQVIEKLKGCENYYDWKISMTTCLELDDLFDTIEVDKGQQILRNPKKSRKAKAKLNSAIDKLLYTHIEGATSPLEIWQHLEKTLADDGFMRQENLLTWLVSTKLVNCVLVDDYVRKMIVCAQKLNSAN